jgi:hypothetical protein
VSRRQVADAWLHIVAEPSPAATYTCAICPYTASATGRRAVGEFVRTIRTDHRATCPTLHPERNAA